MIIVILSVLAILAAFAGGFYAGVKNAGSKKVEKTIDVLNTFTKKD